jgi:Carbohydrate esterase, sialic acid-specific acetylesterase
MNLLKTLSTSVIAALCVSAADAKPLKVFILAGQSNMEGHAMTRTFPAIAKDPKTADLYKDMVDKDGKPVVCENVWIAYSYGGPGGEPGGTKAGKLSAGWGAVANPDKIGPEYTFGITMNKMLGEPILLIKTAWGGRSLYNDFRSPSAGENKVIPAEKMTNDKHPTTGVNYKLMMDYVKEILANPKTVCPVYDPKEGYELAGFVWFQGFNDMVGPYPELPSEEQPGKKAKKVKGAKDYSEYSRLLACFIRDVRKDLSAPQMPFVIGVMGIGGKTDSEGKIAFRKAMAAPAEMPEFKGNVVNVFTENYWPAELDPVQDKLMQIKKDSQHKGKGGKEEDVSKEELKKGRDQAKTDKEAKIKETLNSEEMWLLENAISNQQYHYHGSAKFFGQVGKAFAEALVKQMKGGK